jgi:hypothetical protein
MPPPEFHLESWRESLEKLRSQEFKYIAPTHFGIFSDPGWHLRALEKVMDEVEDWIKDIMPRNLDYEELNEEFLSWTRKRSLSEGVSESVLNIYEAANPSWMSTQGIQRYWAKYKTPPD